jgi:hypothetical protein
MLHSFAKQRIRKNYFGCLENDNVRLQSEATVKAKLWSKVCPEKIRERLTVLEDEASLDGEAQRLGRAQLRLESAQCHSLDKAQRPKQKASGVGCNR